ncbi:MAG TPA: low temperature requirement protein A [Solirubrobacterales bacterium]|nr:low temperature requirement protein A [Solirubrobacterales bacterium]
MENPSESRRSRLAHIRREGERVTPLELFFDLVFVLAITQCTALMSHDQTWSGLAQGLLVLGVLWWAWVGYSWLTSVIDPEAEAIRLVIFVAMAALLIVSLAVPEAFGSLALTFALGIGAFRVAHIALFMLAGAEDEALRRSVIGLAVSTAVAVGLLVLASLFDGIAQGSLWALALFLDMAGPYFFGSEGWKLVPHHFAERHGLILIIALGESIVAIGVGASGALDLGIGTAAVLGVGLAAALWWIYFDVVALISARRLGEAEVGKAQNELARDSYSYIHLALVAGIVLGAFGLKVTIGHHADHLHDVPAFALLGGVAVYLLGLVAFRYRHVRSINRQRLGLAIVLLVLVPVATEVPALVSLAIVDVLIWSMIAYERRGYGARRDELRREANLAHSAAVERPTDERTS